MYDIKEHSMYGKRGVMFLDYEMPKNPQGIFVYPLTDRESVMIECIWKGVFREKEGIYSKRQSRKLAQIEILNRWMPTVMEMINRITGGGGKVDKQLEQQKAFREIGV